jgi:NAD(P)H-hydrate epimerase
MRSLGDGPALALDVPSGLELATGSVHEPAVRATATLTLAAPKHGLEAHPAHVGALYLADISVPSTVLDPALSAAWSNPFGDDPLVRLR